VPAPGQLPVIIEMTNGERFFGYFDDPDWKARLDTAGAVGPGRRSTLMMKLDEPWPGGVRTKIIDLVKVKSWFPEKEREWITRHKEGWTKAGYADHSAGDQLYFVSREEAKYAEMAQAWADEAYPPPEAAPSEETAEVRKTEAVTPAPPSRGPLGRWGAHAGIAATGAVLALAVWKALLSE
jgi:hypothetical protein